MYTFESVLTVSGYVKKVNLKLITYTETTRKKSTENDAIFCIL